MDANQRQPEIVRIGVSGARIVGVIHKRIDYIDMAGQERFIDLEKCTKNWKKWFNANSQEFLPFRGATEQSIVTWNACCVGMLGALDNPPWAEFKNERKTRFEFESYKALYAHLIGPLNQAGWVTFDAN